jgi:hypothetical protein
MSGQGLCRPSPVRAERLHSIGREFDPLSAH